MKEQITAYMTRMLRLPGREAEELFHLYLVTLDEYGRKIHRAAADHDFARLRVLLHSLRGCSVNIGVDAVSGSLRKLSLAIEAFDHAAAEAAGEELRSVRRLLAE